MVQKGVQIGVENHQNIGISCQKGGQKGVKMVVFGRFLDQFLTKNSAHKKTPF